jgi:hypothetical protein
MGANLRCLCISTLSFRYVFLRSLLFAVMCLSMAVLRAAERPRLAVLTDIGGDPDDQQSMIRLMVYSNEFDLELLIASAAGTPGELKDSITRPDLIHQIIDAYGEVLPNLQRHAGVAGSRVASRPGDFWQSPSRPGAHRRRP